MEFTGLTRLRPAAQQRLQLQLLKRGGAADQGVAQCNLNKRLDCFEKKSYELKSKSDHQDRLAALCQCRGVAGH